jgi:hypothetical protein
MTKTDVMLVLAVAIVVGVVGVLVGRAFGVPVAPTGALAGVIAAVVVAARRRRT